MITGRIGKPHHPGQTPLLPEGVLTASQRSYGGHHAPDEVLLRKLPSSLQRLRPLFFVRRRILRLLPNCCQGRYAAADFNLRCNKLQEGNNFAYLRVSHKTLAAKATKDFSAISDTPCNFSKTDRAATLTPGGGG